MDIVQDHKQELFDFDKKFEDFIDQVKYVYDSKNIDEIKKDIFVNLDWENYYSEFKCKNKQENDQIIEQNRNRYLDYVRMILKREKEFFTNNNPQSQKLKKNELNEQKSHDNELIKYIKKVDKLICSHLKNTLQNYQESNDKKKILLILINKGYYEFEKYLKDKLQVNKSLSSSLQQDFIKLEQKTKYEDFIIQEAIEKYINNEQIPYTQENTRQISININNEVFQMECIDKNLFFCDIIRDEEQQKINYQYYFNGQQSRCIERYIDNTFKQETEKCLIFDTPKYIVAGMLKIIQKLNYYINYEAAFIREL
ncbi:hypothetical protein PPERSA_10200 [Pseudocohnilembus persalinus]|uniref:Uncharacterized protein n=1 Tax=Pseudocohnilembus persalinus TaxID=266149 RepID=A0A0V0QLC9_PSEPJ|nr:hypothetical protein PPERSA_10200 [Pseudocohnilembus persalinus]|eukprot:KRX03119.1 hypothetical protein PPERSA_10200 [Pseudocohnilembus persalinus]